MRAYVVMGVSGCGKSAIGRGVAEAVGGRFIDGDEFHPAANIAKMSRGEPLTDADREPWLDKVGDCLRDLKEPTFVACSALKRSYRRRIAERAAGPVAFLFLEGSRDVLRQRMADREGHFMPVALLDSQLQTLEPPGKDELAVKVSIDQSPDQVIAELLKSIGKEIA